MDSKVILTKASDLQDNFLDLMDLKLVPPWSSELLLLSLCQVCSQSAVQAIESGHSACILTLIVHWQKVIPCTPAKQMSLETMYLEIGQRVGISTGIST